MKVHRKLYYKDFHFLLWRIIRRGGYTKVGANPCGCPISMCLTFIFCCGGNPPRQLYESP